MLIRLTIENYLSYGAKTELNLLSGKIQKHNNHVVQSQSRSDVSLLRLGLIYGANGSGKSNLIKVLQYLKKLVTEGSKHEELLEYKPNLLSVALQGKNSEIEVELRINGRNYAYGIVFNEKAILEEWLYEITKKGETLVYERVTNEKNIVDVTLGKPLLKNNKHKEYLKFVALGTRPNQPYLTECNERNIKNALPELVYLTEPYQWFKEKLTIVQPETENAQPAIEMYLNSASKEKIVEYLKRFDIGVSDITVTQKDDKKETDTQLVSEHIHTYANYSSLDALDGVRQRAIHYVGTTSKGKKVQTLNLLHTGEKGSKPVQFELEQESDGTKRLLNLLPLLIESVKDEKVLIIDELDRSLHPTLAKEFVKLYLELSRATQSQMIVTTHETGFLDLEEFRADELWFVEKKNGQTEFFSLTDFDVRFDKRIRKDYLLGRFGAVPNIKTEVQL
mgnify:CR=1 FL=1